MTIGIGKDALAGAITGRNPSPLQMNSVSIIWRSPKRVRVIVDIEVRRGSFSFSGEGSSSDDAIKDAIQNFANIVDSVTPDALTALLADNGFPGTRDHEV